jgi:hypothetical protein
VVGQSVDDPYKTPTKLINAASFGVPSVAYPLSGYKEWMHYTPATDIVEGVKNLKFDSKELIEASEYYHISNVAKRYEALNSNSNI